MTTTDERLQDQADQLDDLASRLAALEGRQAVATRTELEARLTPGTPARAGDGTVLGGLALGMVSQAPGNATPYASTFRAVGVVAVLPTLPDPDYRPGSCVVLTTNGQLYRNNADTWTAVVAEVANSDGHVVIGPSGIAITNGEISVTNGGATVIIDGTSDMFKIAATGTLALAFPAAPGNSVATVTLTGLGAAYVTSPVMLSQMTLVSGGVTDARYGHFIADVVNTTGHVNYHAHNNIHLDASPGQAVVGLQTFSNLASPATTAAVRYYVLIEAGI